MAQRRSFLAASSLLGVLGTLGVPVLARAQSRIEIRMWTLLSGGDGARMRSLIDDFNASQRGVRVVSKIGRAHV